MKGQNFLFLAIYFVFFLLIGYQIQYIPEFSYAPVSSHFYPYFIVAIGLVFGVAELIKNVVGESQNIRVFKDIWKRALTIKRIIILLSLVIYITIIPIIGFILATCLYTLTVSLSLASEISLRTIIAAVSIAIVLNGFIYYIVVVLLKGFLP